MSVEVVVLQIWAKCVTVLWLKDQTSACPLATLYRGNLRMKTDTRVRIDPEKSTAVRVLVTGQTRQGPVPERTAAGLQPFFLLAGF